ncbi:protein NRT1/ PTR FAMILY 4.5 isoform X2 [Andrographis paniculata]|nr:protein NRT1/ PTR FAMILY 4.5 isoform X2 [Andrographis paniculata]
MAEEEDDYAPLDKSGLVAGKVDWKGKAARKDKHGGIYASAMILGVFGFEGVVIISLASNLVTYFNGVMHLDMADAANQLSNFMGTNNMLTVLVAVVADAYVGRFTAILAAAAVEFLGVGLLGLQAHLPSLKPPPLCGGADPNSGCEPVGGANAAFLFTALYLVALGSGGVKAALPAHGADQFDENDPIEATQKSSYFNWILVSAMIGNLIGVTAIVYIQYNRGWDVAFGVCALSMLAGIGILVAGLPWYRIHAVNGSNVLLEIISVFVAAINNRRLKLPDDPNKLHEAKEDDEEEHLPHTNAFPFLDKAAIKGSPWKLCTVTQVENVKIILNMVPVFVCTVIMTLCLSQLQTFSVQQATTMNLTIAAGFKIPPASLPVIPFISLLIITPIYDRVLVPYLRKVTGIPTGISYLQRVGVGLFLAVVSMAAAALVEVKRRRVAFESGLVDSDPKQHPLPMSVFWLSFQFFVFGIADLFTFVGLMEFFYSQVPDAIKAVSGCFLWTSMALGYFTSTIVVKVVNQATKNSGRGRGWVGGNNINRNRLDLFYLLLAMISFVNFCIYIPVAKRYVYRKEIRTVTVTGGREKEEGGEEA